MKKLLALFVLLALTLSLQSQNEFKLGFTGTYPTYYNLYTGMPSKKWTKN
ncbi:MAG TPA: hypothetical protein PKE39_16650 [Ignavibacteria bacterium]|nr:hypothetical protein [Ignavibacteria bacterium]